MYRLAEFPEDLALVERAVEAVAYEAEPLQIDTVIMGCRTGSIDVFIHRGTVTALFYNKTSAQVIMLYHEGNPFELYGDMKAILHGMHDKMKERGLRHLYAALCLKNDYFEKLKRVYFKLLHFEPESLLLYSTREMLTGGN